jgi:uncharacterized protein (DUF302 family)
MTSPIVVSTTILVEHVTILTPRTFEEVRHKLENSLPRIGQSIVDTLSVADEAGVEEYERTGPKLSIFLERDHGTILRGFGGRRKAIQYEIGNPLTATKMTRYRLGAALYAPLRIVLFENDEGLTVMEYDKPSSLFGQFADARVSEVGRSLDVELLSVLTKVSS